MYTEDSLQQVRDVDPKNLIGRYTELKHAGGNRWKGLCPLPGHNEKTPSFTVTSEGWKCFGCNAGGNVIDFVMIMDRLEFADAVRMVADVYGITLVEIDDKHTPEQRKQQKDEKAAMYELMEWSCQIFEGNLDDERLELLYARGVTDDDIKRWRIGYAPDAWRTITGAVVADGRLPMAVKLDLVKEKEEASGDVKYYDTWRNRIMLPICDTHGKVVAYGGWAVSDKDKAAAKYINSAETPLYKKRGALYGLHIAKNAMIQAKRAAMVEGYFDVITCHRRGMANVVGTCGTALSEEHLLALGKYSLEYMDLLYDQDAAGKRAALKAVDMVLKAGMIPRVGQWDGDIKDVDELLRR